MKYIMLAVALAIALPAQAGPTEYNAALDQARKAHVKAVAVCKTLPKLADVVECVNTADGKLAEAEKVVRAAHLPSKGAKP